MDPTLKFQQALPYAVLPLSPQLSALHSSRVRTLSALPPFPYFCSHCGHHFSSTTHLRLARTKRHKRPAAARTTCLICHHAQDIEVNLQKSVLHPKKQGPSPDIPVTTNDGNPAEKPIQCTKQQPKLTDNSKPRVKKKSTLQEMLLRSKSREVKAQEPAQASGLAQFLSGL